MSNPQLHDQTPPNSTRGATSSSLRLDASFASSDSDKPNSKLTSFTSPRLPRLESKTSLVQLCESSAGPFWSTPGAKAWFETILFSIPHFCYHNVLVERRRCCSQLRRHFETSSIPLCHVIERRHLHYRNQELERLHRGKKVNLWYFLCRSVLSAPRGPRVCTVDVIETHVVSIL